MAIVWINPRVPSLGVDAERDFFPMFSSLIKYTKTTKEDSLVLVLDGQYSHTRNLEVISLAQENHVDGICLQPHRSHKIQPLDKDFMGPLKTFYCQEIGKMPRLHPGRVVTVNQLAKCSEMHTSDLQQAK